MKVHIKKIGVLMLLFIVIIMLMPIKSMAAAPVNGEKHTQGDYEYAYNQYWNQTVWEDDTTQNGWGVKVLDTTKSSYGEMVSTIGGKPVNSAIYTFSNCTNLVNAPAIPDSVVFMFTTFEGCTNLLTVPTLPNSIIEMGGVFANCTNLITAPILPNRVENISTLFNDCINLVNAPEIPESVTNMSYTFSNCQSLVTAPLIPNSVTDMYNTFDNCTSLKTISKIPEKVIDAEGLFGSCTSLSGSIDFWCNPTSYRQLFCDATANPNKLIINFFGISDADATNLLNTQTTGNISRGTKTAPELITPIISAVDESGRIYSFDEWTNKTLTVTIENDPNNPICELMYSINSGAWEKYSVPIVMTNQGNNTITVKAVKGDYVSPMSAKSILIDKTVPNIPEYDVKPGTVWADKNFILNFADVSYDGLSDAYLEVKYPDVQTWELVTDIHSYIIAESGIRKFRWVDMAGNISAQVSFDAKIDNIAPVLTVSGNISDWSTASSITLSISATDANSGIKRIRIKDGVWKSGSNLTYSVKENNDYYFEAEDNVGNIGYLTVSVTFLDRKPPIVTNVQFDDAWSVGKQVTITATDDNESGVKGYAITKSNTKPAISEFNTNNIYNLTENSIYYAWAIDNLNQISEGYRFIISTIKADIVQNDTAPYGTIVQAPTKWTSGDVKITINVKDDSNSGLTSIKNPDGTITDPRTFEHKYILSEGIYGGTAQNPAGNYSIWQYGEWSPILTSALNAPKPTETDVLKIVAEGQRIHSTPWSNWQNSSYGGTNTDTIQFSGHNQDVYNHHGSLRDVSWCPSTSWCSYGQPINTDISSRAVYRKVTKTVFLGVAHGGYGFPAHTQWTEITACGCGFGGMGETSSGNCYNCYTTKTENVFDGYRYSCNNTNCGCYTYYQNTMRTREYQYYHGYDYQTRQAQFAKEAKYEYIVKENGNYTFQITNGAGKVTDFNISVNNIDKTKPTTPIVTGKVDGKVWNGEWTNKNMEITIGGSVAHSGIVKYEYSINNGANWILYNPSSKPIFKEDTTLAVRAIGGSGLISDSCLFRAKVDQKLPAITISNLPTEFVSSCILQIDSTDFGNSGVKNVYITNTENNKTTLFTSDAPEKHLTNTSSYTTEKGGNYLLEVEDWAGNKYSYSQLVKYVDGESPVLSHILTYNKIKNEAEILITATERGYSGVKYVYLPNGETTNLPQTKFWVKENGVYKFKAIDNMLNETGEYSVEVTGLVPSGNTDFKLHMKYGDDFSSHMVDKLRQQIYLPIGTDNISAEFEANAIGTTIVSINGVAVNGTKKQIDFTLNAATKSYEFVVVVKTINNTSDTYIVTISAANEKPELYIVNAEVIKGSMFGKDGYILGGAYTPYESNKKGIEIELAATDKNPEQYLSGYATYRGINYPITWNDTSSSIKSDKKTLRGKILIPSSILGDESYYEVAINLCDKFTKDASSNISATVGGVYLSTDISAPVITGQLISPTSYKLSFSDKNTIKSMQYEVSIDNGVTYSNKLDYKSPIVLNRFYKNTIRITALDSIGNKGVSSLVVEADAGATEGSGNEMVDLGKDAVYFDRSRLASYYLYGSTAGNSSLFPKNSATIPNVK